MWRVLKLVTLLFIISTYVLMFISKSIELSTRYFVLSFILVVIFYFLDRKVLYGSAFISPTERERLMRVEQRRTEIERLKYLLENCPTELVSSNSSYQIPHDIQQNPTLKLMFNCYGKSISKSILINPNSEYGKVQGLMIDDPNKEFILLIDKILYRFDFNKLSDFEYIEDGEKVVSGKGVATVIGGLTFGLLGAMAGAAGSRKHKDYVTRSEIRVIINDLKYSSIRIPLLDQKISTKSDAYKNSLKTADELIGALTYIKNNN